MLIECVKNPTARTIPFAPVTNGLWPGWEYMINMDVPASQIEEAQRQGAEFTVAKKHIRDGLEYDPT